MTFNSIHYPAINREQSFFRDWSGKNAQIEKFIFSQGCEKQQKMIFMVSCKKLKGISFLPKEVSSIFFHVTR